MPERIQLKRTKGWRMPANTVKVDRTTKFGNTVKVGPGCTAEQAVAVFRRAIEDDNATCILAFKPSRDLHSLRGKNVACWCKLPDLGQPDICHAAVLLEVANA